MITKDKIVLITGAAGGIGESTVKILLENGAKIVATDLNQDSLDALKKKYPSENLAVKTLDVTDYEATKEVIEFAIQTFGSFDTFIANAGVGVGKLFLEHQLPADKNFDLHVNVNQRGVYYGIHAAAHKFIELKKPGKILITTSVYGSIAAELSFSYNMTKAANDMMVKCAALELAPHHISVIGVAPGRIDTPILNSYRELGLFDHVKNESMSRDVLHPDTVGNMFTFLTSDMSQGVNGTTVYVDDGFSNFKFPLLPE